MVGGSNAFSLVSLISVIWDSLQAAALVLDTLRTMEPSSGEAMSSQSLLMEIVLYISL